ncbi:MAG: hypothetical protein JSS20_11480 [Proteobacteria bacterium]|nr:hypothetical protein [Pseudomonadota bacterium]
MPNRPNPLRLMRAADAVLDRHGSIVETNEAWDRFARAHTHRLLSASVGENYLDLCDPMIYGALREQLRELLSGTRNLVGSLFPVASSPSKLWIALIALPGSVSKNGRGVASVFHIDVTEMLFNQAAPGTRQLIDDLQTSVTLDPAQLLKTTFMRAIESFVPQGREGASIDEWGTITPREREVVQKIAQGKSNREIAHDLGCAENTTKRHVTSIMKKLRVSSRGQIVAKFYDSGSHSGQS